MSYALLRSVDPAWAQSSGLETTLGGLGFRLATQAQASTVPESIRLVLVDCRRGVQTANQNAGGVALPAGCACFAIVDADASVPERLALTERFHAVLPLPLDECALVDALTARRYVAISASEQRSFGAKLHELSCGDTAVAQHFIRLLVDTNRTTLAALRDAFGASSWDGVASAAHRIAGSMRLLDCAGMIALLIRLEEAARTRNAALARAILAMVAESLDYLDTSLEKLLDAAPSHYSSHI